jgi:hypothetical protein
MVRILPALVGAVALGAATVLRNKKRSAKKALATRSKAMPAKRARKTAPARTAPRKRSS